MYCEKVNAFDLILYVSNLKNNNSQDFTFEDINHLNRTIKYASNHNFSYINVFGDFNDFIINIFERGTFRIPRVGNFTFGKVL